MARNPWKSAWSWFREHVLDRMKETWDRFQRDDGSLMAAAVSYYAGISLIPLLIVLVSGLGYVMEATQVGQDAQQQVLNTVQTEGSPQLRRQVQEILQSVSQGASVGGTLGFVGLLFGAIAIFAQFERAFDRIWGVEDQRGVGLWKTLHYTLLLRFRAFLMLFALGLLVFVVFIAGMTLATIERLAAQWWPIPHAITQLMELGTSLLLNTLVFTLLYRLLPKVEVRWREALAGGVLVAIGWEIGRQVLSSILIGTRYSNAYGAIGSFLAVLLWLYYASHLLFLGAEFIQVICKRCDPAPENRGS